MAPCFLMNFMQTWSLIIHLNKNTADRKRGECVLSFPEQTQPIVFWSSISNNPLLFVKCEKLLIQEVYKFLFSFNDIVNVSQHRKTLFFCFYMKANFSYQSCTLGVVVNFSSLCFYIHRLFYLFYSSVSASTILVTDSCMSSNRPVSWCIKVCLKASDSLI